MTQSAAARQQRSGEATPGAPPKRERNAESTKRALLDAGELEFAAKGFDGARLQSIAKAVGVQQALIHHYFEDKVGLYRAVIERGLAAVTAGSFGILERGASPAPGGEARALLESFVELLLDFYANHAPLLSILRHDAQLPVGTIQSETPPELRAMLVTHIRPVFEAVVERIETLQRGKKLRKDFDARQVLVSALAMAAFPFQEMPMVAALWPDADFRSPGMLAARKSEIVETVLARVAFPT